jgi:hypothetical protein
MDIDPVWLTTVGRSGQPNPKPGPVPLQMLSTYSVPVEMQLTRVRGL